MSNGDDVCILYYIYLYENNQIWAGECIFVKGICSQKFTLFDVNLDGVFST